MPKTWELRFFAQNKSGNAAKGTDCVKKIAPKLQLNSLFFFSGTLPFFFVLLLEPQLLVLESEAKNCMCSASKVQIDDVRAFFQRMDKDSPKDQVLEMKDRLTVALFRPDSVVSWKSTSL